MTEKLSKADRLAIAAYAAPRLRSTDAQKKQRKVKLTDKDGNVVREITGAEYEEGVFLRAGIELAVGEGVRPETILCEYCRKPVKVTGSAIPRTCRDGCSRHCDTEGCKGRVGLSGAFNRARGHVATVYCRPCVTKAWQAKMSPEKRAEAIRKNLEARPKEARSVAAKKANANRTREQRAAASELRREMNRSRTPEENAENGRRALDAKTPAILRAAVQKGNEKRAESLRRHYSAKTQEERSERIRKVQANRTPEERSKIGQKAHATRKAKRFEALFNAPADDVVED